MKTSLAVLICNVLAVRPIAEMKGNNFQRRPRTRPFTVENDWPDQFYIGEKKGGKMADEMQDWADSDEIWSVSNNTGRRNGKKLNDWM